MTHTIIAGPSRTRPVTRALPIVALIAGGALVVDTVTIAVINRSFDPLDSILFLTGFVAMILTVALLSVELSASRRGGRRVAMAAGIFLLAAAVLGVVSLAFDEMGRHVFSASNKGLHGEWSFFSIGICLLLTAAWAAHRPRSR